MGNVLSVIAGLSGGIIMGSAACSFYVALGVFTKITSFMTNAVQKTALIIAMLGVSFGGCLYLFKWFIPGGVVLELIAGLSGGIFTGMYIACIAEVVDLIPFMHRMGITRNMIISALLAFAIGKCLGLIYHFTIQ